MVGKGAQWLECLAFKRNRIGQGKAEMAQRMAPASVGVASQQHFISGVDEQQLGVVAFAAKFGQPLRHTREITVAAHVDGDGE